MITLELTTEEAEVLLEAVCALQEEPDLSAMEMAALANVHAQLAEAL